ncbi:hypothetical protein EJB05_10197, partial [Eragrostis curvula]
EYVIEDSEEIKRGKGRTAWANNGRAHVGALPLQLGWAPQPGEQPDLWGNEAIDFNDRLRGTMDVGDQQQQHMDWWTSALEKRHYRCSAAFT